MKPKNDMKNSYPGSEKIYVSGKLYDIRVGMRKVNLTDTVKIIDGKRIVRHNDPVYVYDTSGVYTDPEIEIDLEKGLPRLRESWITERNDVERLSEITSQYGRSRMADRSLDAIRFKNVQLPYRAQKGKKLLRCTTPKKESLPRKWNM